MNIPFDRVIWSADQCAQYLDVSKAHFLNSVQHAQGFPRPLPLPSYHHAGKERRLESRWRAQEVTAWALGEITQPSRTADAST